MSGVVRHLADIEIIKEHWDNLNGHFLVFITV